MKKILYLIILSFLFCGLSFSQNVLTHNTGVLQISITDNGIVGHGAGNIGDGVIFDNAPDAMWRSSILLATPQTGAIGAFHSYSVSISDEMVNITPFSSFISLPNYNEVTEATFNGSGAPDANKIGVEVYQSSYTNTGDQYMIISLIVTNTSGAAINDLYVGYFADWDVAPTYYTNNKGGYDKTRNLAYQYYGGGIEDTNYYGITALSGMAGARVASYDAASEAELRDSAYMWISTFLDDDVSIEADYRSYIGSGPYNLAAGASQNVVFAYVVGKDLEDLKATADAAMNDWMSSILPVELTSFSYNVNNGNVQLNWSTATETNNRMFEIQRKTVDGNFATIGYVNGAGTKTEQTNYSYVDKSVNSGNYVYRLKQIDFNGQFDYSEELMVNVTPPLQFTLSQNYPNPFNPATSISFGIDKPGLVKVVVYNLLGQQIATLLNEYKQAGYYKVNFDASSLPSGTYLYKLESGNNVQVKKMTLLK